jgi:amino acid transporter
VSDRDETRLAELGYEQELKRGLSAFDTIALGFAGISPVVGLYAVVLVGTAVAGPAWIWVLPVALAGQCLLLAVYSELASEFPIAGGPYQWSRRLLGSGYGWFNGWVALCAYAAANTTIAYLGAPWLLTLFGIEPSPEAIVAAGFALVLTAALLGALGIDLVARIVRVGILAEVLASVGIALTLLLLFRDQDISILGETLGAEALSGGSVLAAMLAALAVGGWVFIGFDCAVGVAEETHDAARHVPRAIWFALLSVGVLVIANAIAVTLAHPNPAGVVAGEDLDPVTTAVTSSFGAWSDKPFAAVVLCAFVACSVAAQGVTARMAYSMARDENVPGSRWLARVDGRGNPIGGIFATAAVGCTGLLLGLEATAVGSLIAFGTAAIYVSFLMIASAALIARLRGTWSPAGGFALGPFGLPLNIAAVAWLAFETINIAWPRESLAPPGAPFYQVWAAPLVLALILVVGLAYLAFGRIVGAADRPVTGPAG